MKLCTCSRPLIAALVVLSMMPPAAAAAAAEAADPSLETSAPDTPPIAADPPPDPPPAAEAPDVACFEAARVVARRQAPTPPDAAYTCDLAVQMARDTGSPSALAAALANRALVLIAQGRLEPALADLDSAAAQAPGNAAIHGNRGNLLLRMGRVSDAVIAHDRAVDLAPADPAAYFNRAFSYQAAGEPALAAEDVARARALLERQGRALLERQGRALPERTGAEGRQREIRSGGTAAPDGARGR